MVIGFTVFGTDGHVSQFLNRLLFFRPVRSVYSFITNIMVEKTNFLLFALLVCLFGCFSDVHVFSFLNRCKI
jgi:hypothetical protein